MKHWMVCSALMAFVLVAAAAPLCALETAGALEPPQRILRAAPPQVGAKDTSRLARAGNHPGQIAAVLLVDDDWDYELTNPGSQGGLPFYTSALDRLGISWDVWDTQTALQPAAQDMAGYAAVVWFTGYAYGQFGQDPGVFTAANEAAVKSYLDDGGNLILSSEEYYFGTSDTITDFMVDYLGIADINDDVVITTTLGIEGNPIGDGLGPYVMARPDDYGTYWPTDLYQGPYDDEVIAQQPTAETPFRYAPWNNQRYSATNRQGAAFKTMYLAFPLEWIDTVGERAQILGLALEWMGFVLPAAGSPSLEPIDNADLNSDYVIDWSDVTGATGYVLEEDESSDFSSASVRYSGPHSQVQVLQQDVGTWFYRVKAHNAGGDSGWSEVSSATVTLLAPPAPELYAIDNPTHSGSFLVDWGDVEGVNAYELQEDDGEAFWTPQGIYYGADSYAQVDQHPGGTWYFRVRTTGDAGKSVWSNVVPVGVVPLPPEMLAISNPEGDGTYDVQWQPSASATDYTLQEDDNPEFESPVVRCSGMGRSCHITNQPLGGWYYRVLASNAYGPGPWSDPPQSTGVFSGAPVLEPIDNAYTFDSYELSWSGVGGATGYRLEEDGDPIFASPTVRYEGVNIQYQITGQRPGTWYYRVLAYNGGGVSAFSNIEAVTYSQVVLPLILRTW